MYGLGDWVDTTQGPPKIAKGTNTAHPEEL